MARFVRERERDERQGVGLAERAMEVVGTRSTPPAPLIGLYGP
jgi:hypothetical protein